MERSKKDAFSFIFEKGCQGVEGDRGLTGTTKVYRGRGWDVPWGGGGESLTYCVTKKLPLVKHYTTGMI